MASKQYQFEYIYPYTPSKCWEELLKYGYVDGYCATDKIRLNVYRDKKGTRILKFFVPGFEKTQLELKITDGSLVLTANCDFPKDQECFFQNEVNFTGKLLRSVTLLDKEKVEDVQLANGVLTVKLVSETRKESTNIPIK